MQFLKNKKMNKILLIVAILVKEMISGYDQIIAQWGSSVGFLKSYFLECKSGRNSIKVAEKWT